MAKVGSSADRLRTPRRPHPEMRDVCRVVRRCSRLVQRETRHGHDRADDDLTERTNADERSTPRLHARAAPRLCQASSPNPATSGEQECARNHGESDEDDHDAE